MFFAIVCVSGGFGQIQSHIVVLVGEYLVVVDLFWVLVDADHCQPLWAHPCKEVASSGSHTGGPQQKVTTGQRKSRRGGAATCGSVTIEGQMLSQAETLDDTPDEVFTQTADQTLAQNSDDPVIRRQDIVSLVQEIVTYVEFVNNTLGSGQQGSLSPPIEWPNVTTTTTTGVPPSVTTTTTTTTTVVPPQDMIALNPPVLIQRFGAFRGQGFSIHELVGMQQADAKLPSVTKVKAQFS